MDTKSSPRDNPGHSTHEFTLPYSKRETHEASDDPPEIKVPKIPPVGDAAALALRARGLAGKFVDEFGNVLNWDGTVLGSVQGDLPAMVGRPVSDSGEVLDSDGEVAGYVSENHSLRDLVGAFKIDEEGNILDGEGNVVGRMNTREAGREEAAAGAEASTGQGAAERRAKPSATPSPSEIYLDVKSTHDGIQLIIKIPTVFNPEK